MMMIIDDTREKNVVDWEGIENHIESLLQEIQESLFNIAMTRQQENTTAVDTYEDFKTVIMEKGGFVSAHWDGTAETENKIKEETKATIRCIPLDVKEESGKCIYTGNPSKHRVLFAKAY